MLLPLVTLAYVPLPSLVPSDGCRRRVPPGQDSFKPEWMVVPGPSVRPVRPLIVRSSPAYLWLKDVREVGALVLAEADLHHDLAVTHQRTVVGLDGQRVASSAAKYFWG